MAKEIKDKSEKELKKELAEKRTALRDFRFSLAGTKIRDVKEGRKLKKEVARILTELKERELKNV